ncbi:hypothetical protein HELRODRAFT_171275 [Helobdella robusta]|uniref:Uncharacterized protein n=1 Tax=Helobdella robusta TaxID=6412 RepID=T1F408_HELRO|nr:hypothetical protein HELRODRAFT_171275 [Helobdella robusta]ESO05621.1 hypothetical protein HELRODRAFT_171275 [Helobdella robusta]
MTPNQRETACKKLRISARLLANSTTTPEATGLTISEFLTRSITWRRLAEFLISEHVNLLQIIMEIINCDDENDVGGEKIDDDDDDDDDGNSNNDEDDDDGGDSDDDEDDDDGGDSDDDEDNDDDESRLMKDCAKTLMNAAIAIKWRLERKKRLEDEKDEEEEEDDDEDDEDDEEEKEEKEEDEDDE